MKLNEIIEEVAKIEGKSEKIKYLEKLTKKVKDKNLIEEIKVLIESFKERVESLEEEVKEVITPRKEIDEVQIEEPKYDPIEVPIGNVEASNLEREVSGEIISNEEQTNYLVETPTDYVLTTVDYQDVTGTDAVYSIREKFIREGTFNPDNPLNQVQQQNIETRVRAIMPHASEDKIMAYTKQIVNPNDKESKKYIARLQ